MDNLIMNGSQQLRCTGMRSSGGLLTVAAATLARPMPAAAFVDVRPPAVLTLGAAPSFDHQVKGIGIHAGTETALVYGGGQVDKTDATPVGSADWSPPI